MGKLAYKAAAKTGAASFDARQVGGVGKSLGVGEGAKGGYTKRIKEAKEEQKKFYGKDGLGFVDTDTEESQLKIKARTEEIKKAKQKEIDETAAAFDRATTDEEREKLLIKDGKLKKEQANADKAATAEVKFSRQIAYMEQLQKQKSRWGMFGNRYTESGGTAAGGVIGGVAGGIATGATGGIYGAAAGAGARAKVDELAAIIKELDKEYGKGGAETVGKEKAKGKAKAMIEAMDEMDDAKKDPKKDGAGDSEEAH
jgi:hypothetical protein